MTGTENMADPIYKTDALIALRHRGRAARQRGSCDKDQDFAVHTNPLRYVCADYHHFAGLATNPAARSSE